ncbi:GNAT family N-acetyltransferase [Microbacteriaceae bacterium 4G12]
MIRQARKEDSQAAAPLLYDALHDIAEKISGGTTTEEVLEGLEYWFKQPGNRLSYENCLVKELDGQVVGIIVLYHGKDGEVLDSPIVKRLQKLKHDPTISLEKEAKDDEYYIDTLSVNPNYAGRGIGTELIRAAEERTKQLQHKKIALLVDLTNERAFGLYKKLGYVQDQIISLIGTPYAHLTKQV